MSLIKESLVKNIYLKIIKFLKYFLAAKTYFKICLLICMDIITLTIALLITSILLSVDNFFILKFLIISFLFI